MARRRRDSRGQRLGRALLAPLLAGLLRVLAATWRVERIGEDPFEEHVKSPLLGALWHEDVLASAGLFRDSGAVVPVSRSRDGENITAVMRHLGLGDPPRGSSSRGGSVALRSVVRALRADGIVALLVDGPRGPRREAKPGIVAAARLSGVPIRPIAVVARPRIRFGSWDRTQLPLPFARVVLAFGTGLPVPRECSGHEQETLRAELARRLASLRAAAHARLEAGHRSRPLPGSG